MENPSKKGERIIYKGLAGKAGIPTDEFIPKIMRRRNHHSMVHVYLTPSASTCTNTYKINQTSFLRLSGTG